MEDRKKMEAMIGARKFLGKIIKPKEYLATVEKNNLGGIEDMSGIEDDTIKEAIEKFGLRLLRKK